MWRASRLAETNSERIVHYLRSVSPESATNSQIREATGISLYLQVHVLTQQLMRDGLIRGEQQGREWTFWADESPPAQLASRGRASRRDLTTAVDERLTPRAFGDLARAVMSKHFGVLLAPGQAAGVHKEWDMVSPDGDLVGDAKYFTPVRGQRLPPAKFSVIAEHVWLLEKTGAPVTFLVFGNDRQVPELWLQRYGSLVLDVSFYFLTDGGDLEQLSSDQDR